VSRPAARFVVRTTRSDDFPAIVALTKRVYPSSVPWHEDQLASHLEVFPEGQFVACEGSTGTLVGMAASLIVFWDDYDITASWRDFTDHGRFTNHDPVHGRTLYGAEVMVDRERRGAGIATALYGARRDLVERLGLLRIRAGARLAGYHRYAAELTPEQYVEAVVRRELSDPTLSFQLRRGFHVLGLVPSYLRNDPESQGHAALIEWLNPAVARPEDYPVRVVGGNAAP
jgi:ribosomal protein S18 acetylase RimI-like enzyme